MSWTKRSGVGLLVVVLSGFVTLAALSLGGELTLRYRERHRTSAPGTMPLLFYQHRRLGHALVRSYDYFGWVHVDSQGFRGSEVAEAKKPGVTRIMAVGASTTFDSFVSGDNKTWPARLAFWLDRLAPEQPTEVINAGVPGYRVIDHIIRLQTELYRFKPDVVILYETHNDLFGTLRRAALARENGRGGPPDPTPGEMPVVSPWEHWLSRRSMLYSKVWLRWKALSLGREGKRLNPTGAASVPDVLLEQGLDQFERDLTSFLLMARGMGIRVVVPEIVQVSGVGTLVETDPAIRSVWARGVPLVSVSTVLSAYHRYGERIRAVTGRLGVAFIPTAEFRLRGLEWYVEDDPIHFNDRGADRMGEAMARALLGADVLASAGGQTDGPSPSVLAAGHGLGTGCPEGAVDGTPHRPRHQFLSEVAR